MAIHDYLERIKRIDQLVRLQATGTAKELSEKLGVSKSTVYEYLNIMKEMNAPLKYNELAKTYYYTNLGKFEFGFKLSELSDNELKNTNAGFLLKKYSYFFCSVR